MARSGDVYWSLIKPHWERISIYDGPDVFLREFNKTEERARNLFAAHWCVSEVCNGGFGQLFYNDTGILAPEAEEAFEAIGLPLLAQTVRRATAVFSIPYPRDREARIAQLDSVAPQDEEDDDIFEPLNEKFFELVRAEGGGWDEVADRYAARLTP